ncbi:hypothetical protein E6C70_15975 [Glaciibacter flavus]|uniref:Sulfatase N-terminal domain-containing protein n=1 Tax=Orlajensenia flava TaxID=2565934 RepID=A0A4S4FG21_9MICO|nr:hypothetical protein E6C70_15975 [Glaciibacter flavus]
MKRVAVVVVAIAVTLLVSSCVAAPAGAPASSPVGTAGATRPNIVFVLTDDLAMNLVSRMPHVQALGKAGETFGNYDVVDSLCCPSRSAIFTGEYPHDDGVFTNSGTDGGYSAFNSNGNQQRSFAVALQKAGYRTGFMGKYLNGYAVTDPVPPGWNESPGRPATASSTTTSTRTATPSTSGRRPPTTWWTCWRRRARRSSTRRRRRTSRSCWRWPRSRRTRPTRRRRATRRPTRASRIRRPLPTTRHRPTRPVGSRDARRSPRSSNSRCAPPTTSASRRTGASTTCSATSRTSSRLAGSPARRMSCSVRTTAITWASTGCCPASRPPSTATSTFPSSSPVRACRRVGSRPPSSPTSISRRPSRPWAEHRWARTWMA